MGKKTAEKGKEMDGERRGNVESRERRERL